MAELKREKEKRNAFPNYLMKEWDELHDLVQLIKAKKAYITQDKKTNVRYVRVRNTAKK